MTLQLLWAEYAARHGERAYRYTQFCHHYREWRARQKRSLRQQHRAWSPGIPPQHRKLVAVR
ncbi:MAG: hypothetical protein DSZ00_00020 [Gammaproteobacteria bacterium]|nr:MAG: hypothetical protein DSZ00_00020 [Gammaproteobacteria bacterium]